MIDLLTNFAATCKSGFFGFPTWYQYLELDSNCHVADFTVPGDLILVVLAFVDILLRLAGIVAVVFVIVGGAQYITSQGSPDATAKAQSTIINALIGLIVAVTAIVFVTFIGNRFGV